MKEKLLTLDLCPFCDSTELPTIEWHYEPDDDYGTYPAPAPQGAGFYASCVCGFDSDDFDSPAVVAERWNNRRKQIGNSANLHGGE